MKKTIAIGLRLPALLFIYCCFFFVACQKRLASPVTSAALPVWTFLSEYLSADQLQQLDWSTLQTDTAAHFIRLNFYPSANPDDLILVYLDSMHQCTHGELIGVRHDAVDALPKTVTITSLVNRTTTIISLDHGYGQPLTVADNASVTGLQVPPGTVVTNVPLMMLMSSGTPHASDKGMPTAEYINTSHPFADHVRPAGLPHCYTRMRPPGGGAGGGGGSSFRLPTTIYVDNDYYDNNNHPLLDVAAMISCFNSLPDANAACSIELFSDIPVDSNPLGLFDVFTQSPGHTYLRLSKSSGLKTMQQNIGFYPETGLKSIATTAPIPGVFKDDSGHEFNAAYAMAITPAQLKSLLATITAKAKVIKYDVDDYNCSNFALDIFNSVRPTDPINPVLYDLPGSPNGRGSLIPQGVFQELVRRSTLPADRAHIRISTGTKQYSGRSVSPCK